MNMLAWKVPDKDGPKARCRKILDQQVGEERGPNLADLSGSSSTAIAGRIYDNIGIPRSRLTNVDLGELEASDEVEDDLAGEEEAEIIAAGTALERGLENDLRSALVTLERTRGWYVTHQDRAQDFSQYTHMRHLEAALKSDAVKDALEEVPELLTSLARDYNVKTDVLIGLPNPLGRIPPHVLHAAVSSKLTLRSDRAQNVRTEFSSLVRNRRGRLPHLVVATAEPLPSRLASLTKGTGEIDAVYHLLFEGMNQAISELTVDLSIPRSTRDAVVKQANIWREMVDSGRMLPYSKLADVLRSS
jgi:hypothetical protein